MATKINTVYWGTYDPSSGFNAYQAQYNISNLIRDSKYNPSAPEFDLSVAPWGMGLCNAANVTTALWFRDGTAASTSGNSLVRVSAVDSASSNTPLVLVTGTKFESASESGYYRYIQPSQRIGGQTNSDTNNNIISKCKFDLNDRIAGYSPTNTEYLVGNIKPYAYIKYNSVKVRPRSFTWLNLTNGVLKTVSMQANSTDWTTFQTDVAALSIDDIAITRIEYAFCSKGWVAPNWTDATNVQIQQLTPIPVDADLKQLYFSDDATDEYIPLTGVDVIGTLDISGHETMNGARVDGAQRLPIDNTNYSDCNYKDSNIQQAGNLWNSTLGRKLNHYTENEWEFDDISYSTKGTIYQVVNNTISYVDVGHSFNTDQYYFAIFTKITNTSYNNVANSVKALVLHELAFIGFPIIFERSYYDSEIGDSGVYLPVFDDNLITTGQYVEGTESLNLPNASWTDIYDSTMPAYDPHYTPSPAPEEKDKDLDNIGIYNRFPNSLKVYALTLNEFNSTITALNSIYANDSQGVDNWQKDFNGVNPSDYIVAAYATVLDIDTTQLSPSGISVGVVNLADFEQYAKGYKLPSVVDIDFSCGSVDIESLGDFRDFAPYTQLELYLPLCGTIALDPTYFVGHSVLVRYWIDILTMSCTAAVYRKTDDYTTLYQTVNGVCGASIPLTSLRMGDYQNSIHNIESALKRNEMQTWLSIASAAEKGITALASGGSSMVYDAGGLLSSIANAAGNMQTSSDLQYQLYHTQPAVSQTGTAEPQNAFCVGSMYPILYIKRAITLPSYDSGIYAHTVGHACCINTIIGEMTGYTVASNIKTDGIAATVEEIEMIKQAFSRGVIL